MYDIRFSYIAKCLKFIHYNIQSSMYRCNAVIGTREKQKYEEREIATKLCPLRTRLCEKPSPCNPNSIPILLWNSNVLYFREMVGRYIIILYRRCDVCEYVRARGVVCMRI